MKPVRGFAAETTAPTILCSTVTFRMPLIATHTWYEYQRRGAARRWNSIRWVIVEWVVCVLIFTIPESGLMPFFLYKLFGLGGLKSGVIS